ncbi:MAG: hypothetical protein CVV03_05525 [Firmicutes bacterium HGW-Firmicutes-8]|nr:MAG: hypothetical protein CVV03_05525 [Firmicutes bacterium HGW-Firmicutes-8]
MRPAIIVMSRVPLPGRTKTRLMSHLTAEQCAGLQWAMLRDLGRVLGRLDISLIVFYCDGTPGELARVLGPGIYLPQTGTNLGKRMATAVDYCLKQGFDRVVVTGTDYPALQPEDIRQALSALGKREVVIGPSLDGGYYLLAVKKLYAEMFSLKEWWTDTVLQNTLGNLRGSSISYCLLKPGRDLDTFEDAKFYYQLMLKEKTEFEVFPNNTFSYLHDIFGQPEV